MGESPLEEQAFTHGELLQDSQARIFGMEEKTTRTGKTHRVLVLQPEIYRVIRFNPKNGKEDILLITNILITLPLGKEKIVNSPLLFNTKEISIKPVQ